MNISELTTTQEKSDLLIKARATAWYTPVDLYTPANMSVAWMFLNWAMESQAIVRFGHVANPRIKDEMYDWLHDAGDIWHMPPAVAQAAWLDKVLQLAIEAGLVQP